MTEQSLVEAINVHGGVQVRLLENSVDGIAQSFHITTTTGYFATIPACWCNRVPCLKRGCWDKCKGCHGFAGSRHVEHTRALAAAVAKTYGSAQRGRSSVGTPRDCTETRVRNVSVREWEGGEWAQCMEKLVEAE